MEQRNVVFVKQKTTDDISACLVGSEMCINNRSATVNYSCDGFRMRSESLSYRDVGISSAL